MLLTFTKMIKVHGERRARGGRGGEEEGREEGRGAKGGRGRRVGSPKGGRGRRVGEEGRRREEEGRARRVGGAEGWERRGGGGWRRGGREGWEGPKGGWGGEGRGGGATFRVFTLPINVRSFFLSGGLLVKLWPRVAAMDHPSCAFGLLRSSCVSAGPLAKENGPNNKLAWNVGPKNVWPDWP